MKKHILQRYDCGAWFPLTKDIDGKAYVFDSIEEAKLFIKHGLDARFVEKNRVRIL